MSSVAEPMRPPIADTADHAVAVANDDGLNDRTPGDGFSVALMVGSGVVVAVLNYGLNLLFGWRLSVEAYGQLGVAQTLIFICVSFLQAGFPWVVARSIAQGIHQPGGQDSSADAWRLYKTAFVGNAVLSVTLGVGLLAVYRMGWLSFGPGYGPLLALVAVVILGLGLGAVPNAGLQGLFRFPAIALARVAEVTLNVVVSVTLVLLGLGAVGALAGFAAAAVLVCGLYLWCLRDVPTWSARGWSGPRVLGSALPMTLGMFGVILLTNADLLGVKLLTVGSVASDGAAGTYQAAAVLARAPLFVAAALADALYPRIAREWATSGWSAPSARRLLRLLMLGVLPMADIMLVGAASVLRFFFPEGFADARSTLMLLAGSMACLVLSVGFIAILQAAGHTRATTMAMGLAIAVETGGLLVLIPAFGPQGAAVASFGASVVVLAVLAVLARRHGLGLDNLARHAMALGVLGVLVSPLARLELDRPVVAVWIGLAVAVYAATCLVLQLVDGQAIASPPADTRGAPLTGRSRPLNGLLNVVRWLNALGRRMSSVYRANA